MVRVPEQRSSSSMGLPCGAGSAAALLALGTMAIGSARQPSLTAALSVLRRGFSRLRRRAAPYARGRTHTDPNAPHASAVGAAAVAALLRRPPDGLTQRAGGGRVILARGRAICGRERAAAATAAGPATRRAAGRHRATDADGTWPLAVALDCYFAGYVPLAFARRPGRRPVVAGNNIAIY